MIGYQNFTYFIVPCAGLAFLSVTHVNKQCSEHKNAYKLHSSTEIGGVTSYFWQETVTCVTIPSVIYLPCTKDRNMLVSAKESWFMWINFFQDLNRWYQHIPWNACVMQECDDLPIANLMSTVRVQLSGTVAYRHNIIIETSVFWFKYSDILAHSTLLRSMNAPM